MKHILTVDQFSKEMIEDYCERANYFSQFTIRPRAPGKILVNLFYEPSSRTSSSLMAAMLRLGGQCIPINNVQYSSVVKGESLRDTIRTMECYGDIIALRHPMAGAAQQAAEVASIPIINAGDGENEHPTQALLDFYTIKKEHGSVDGLRVGMMGDLLRGRTVKSLAKLLRRYRVPIAWISPSDLRAPRSLVEEGELEINDLNEVIHQLDVLYVVRTQHERVPQGLDTSGWAYSVTPEHMQAAKPNMLLMHPLPRNEELPVELDSDKRAAYFRQMRHGLFMRMAVLDDLLSK